MMNMNSPTVQHMVNNHGFNPFNNNNYVPNQNVYQQPIQQQYYQYPNQQQYYQQQYQTQYNYSNYDDMPNTIVNNNRGINSSIISHQNNYYGNNITHNQIFNGYTNPYLMKAQQEQMELERRNNFNNQKQLYMILFKNVKIMNKDFDIDTAMINLERRYFPETEFNTNNNISIERRIAIEKNKKIASIEEKLKYCRENNIPVPKPAQIVYSGYISNINNVVNMVYQEECTDIYDYLNNVYPKLYFMELEYKAKRQARNLKNRYNTNDFNKLIDRESSNNSNSYYEKLLNNFSNNGVGIQTSNGLIVTADQMEIKVPDSILKRRSQNQQDLYRQQRIKFYNSIMSKR